MLFLQIHLNEELKDVPFSDLVKLKDKLGNEFQEAVFSGSRIKKERKRPATQKNEDSDDDAPVEVSSKKPVNFLGADKKSSRRNQTESRDPRFDDRSGKFNNEKFRGNYEFVFEMRNQELSELKKQLKKPELDSDKKTEIKFQIQRLENKNRSTETKKIKEEKLKKWKIDAKEARKAGKMPHFKTKKQEKTEELVKQFEVLKQSGKLGKYLEKRRKKVASKGKKKMNL